MILKALDEYYRHCDELPKMGWMKKKIEYLIVIDESGKLINIESTRIDKTHVKEFMIPEESGRTSGIRPYLFNDKLEYICGYNYKQPEKKSELKNNAFITRCRQISEKYPDNIGFKAVVRFYDNHGIEQVFVHPVWNELMEFTGTVSFRLFNSFKIIAEDQELNNEILNNDDNLKEGYCMVTGKYGKLINLSQKFHFPGTSLSGASLISFENNSGYDSWGNKQCGNVQISTETNHNYCAALQKLNANDSKNKKKLNSNRTLLFWSANNSICKKAEYGLFALLNIKKTSDSDLFEVEELFKGIYSGNIKTSENDKFYFIIISGGKSRLGITYWNECTLKDFAVNIHQHFKDMDIVDTRKFKTPYKGLFEMIKSVSFVTSDGKVKNPFPNLMENTLKAILQGTCYPELLYLSALKRIMIEKDKATINNSITRTAILKAYLNRKNINTVKKMEKKLDKENTNPGYLCGRLFAVLEKEQKDTNSNNMSNIKNTYFSSVVDMPCLILTEILKNSPHYERKFKENAKIFYKNLIYNDILCKFSEQKIPTRLSIDDKGYFYVGYAQQNAELYKKNESKNITDTDMKK